MIKITIGFVFFSVHDDFFGGKLSEGRYWSDMTGGNTSSWENKV